jgi:succinyl-diaminopimelate desuccinylase
MVAFLGDLIAIPAMGPDSGGEGESEKVKRIGENLSRFGLTELEHHDAPDPRVPSGVRPNMVVWLRGGSDTGRVLALTHTDVVPPGNLSAWSADPFSAVNRDGKIFGRGAEDNGQSITSSIFALKVLKDLGLRPPCDVGVVLAADEEADNVKGVKHLLARGFFRHDDLIVVGDHGEPKGRLVATVEKTLLWVRVVVKGKQCHASLPDVGVNAFRVTMKFWTVAESLLKQRFGARDDFFDHPFSTFEPTRKDPNIPNINTIPGKDVFYMDSRILPGINPDEVMDLLEEVARDVGGRTGAVITFEVVQRDDATLPTSPDSPSARRVLEAVSRTLKNEPYLGGIGGQTFASPLRAAGFSAVAWETIDNRAHSPDEYAKIENIVNDCRVFTRIFMGR